MSLSLLAAAADGAACAGICPLAPDHAPGGAHSRGTLVAGGGTSLRHGVSKVAATLPLDYARLKRQLTVLTAPPQKPTAELRTFLKMVLGLPPSVPG